MRWGFNFFPAFRGTGARVTYIADDNREVRVELPLNWRTRNYVGTIFGGSLYGAVDPHYMIMLIKILGPEYIVWDKAATIRFKKPGRGTLYARGREDDLHPAKRRRAVVSTQHSLTRNLPEEDGETTPEPDTRSCRNLPGRTGATSA
jgi:acyl-coenzyme A thioesterase PaaI-like protein